jgi:hypothetical protein
LLAAGLIDGAALRLSGEILVVGTYDQRAHHERELETA